MVKKHEAMRLDSKGELREEEVMLGLCACHFNCGFADVSQRIKEHQNHIYSMHFVIKLTESSKRKE